MLLTDNYNNLNNEVELLLTQKDKTIKIEEKLTSMISLKGDLNLTLYVPKSYTGNLLLRNVSGNINSEESISNIKTFTANTVSGEILLISINSDNVSLSSTSGNIKLTDLISKHSNIKTTS